MVEANILNYYEEHPGVNYSKVFKQGNSEVNRYHITSFVRIKRDHMLYDNLGGTADTNSIRPIFWDDAVFLMF